ncbi:MULTISPECIES: AAA family ATPase [Rhodococcus]|uniref:AAA family ATPase n=1 Tax=Rhodococcus oxybenzonivorans TaxID=1990687 RepID=A0AAE4UV96_9NOCA|nr:MULTISPECIES: AAA family ATPase [Rhodococcus]MDV7245506.1 AAA family ATPase [Rhodococcus oxybenzonivorans]MDV7263307.1 AAA family ATPase [Rhodococcus oxybenzonivorans]MDV7276586.1 AAA family ATPase [Rhodococcus oxybenzonivorans]MDV7336487.1 AAA family ATPase [Rhodococcus oxybenzonivorans]MDV7346818.1 AAA family ATPase [Rhodococcus oxybenzonivorans]
MLNTAGNPLESVMKNITERTPRLDAALAYAKVGASVVFVETREGEDRKKPLDLRTARERANDDKAAQKAAREAGNPFWEAMTSGSGRQTATDNPVRLRKYWDKYLQDSGGLEPNVGLDLEGSGVVGIDADHAYEVRDVQERATAGTDTPPERYPMTTASPGQTDAAGKPVHEDGGHFLYVNDVPDLPLVEEFKLPGGAVVSMAKRYIMVPPSRRPEGPYINVGPVQRLSENPWLVELIRAQAAENEVARERRAEAAEERAERRASGEDTLGETVAAWNDAHPWAELLEPHGWTPSPRKKDGECKCPVWKAPGDHGSDKSATAHEAGCTNKWVDLEDGSGPLHFWTSDVPPELAEHAARSTAQHLRVSKLQFAAAMRGQTDAEFMVAEGILGPAPAAWDVSEAVLEGPEDDMSAALNAIVAMAGRSGGSREQRRTRLDEAFLSREDLRNLPPLTPVVDGYLYLDTLAQLNGERGTYKTFLALDWAASVSVGAPWQGRSVKPGPVLYFAGEGVAKFDDRLSAWEAERNGGELSGVEVFRELVDFAAEPSVETDWVYVAAALAAREDKPALIVVDTLARYTPGHEENSAKDMGQLITNLDVVRRVTGACVLTLHHTARGTDHGRGSTSVEGGMQSVFLMRKPRDGEVALHTTKQKDGPELEPMALAVKPVPATGSIVLASAATDPFVVEGRPTIGQHSPNYVRVAATLFRTFGEGTSGGTRAEVKAVLQGDEVLKFGGKPGAVSKAFFNAWGTLERKGALVPVKGNRYLLAEEAAVEYGLLESVTPDEEDEATAPPDEDPEEGGASAAEVAP